MKHQLYLLRHAHAQPWSMLGNDFSRSLSGQGTHHAQLISRWALATLPPPDTILCSPAKRTRETLAPLLAQWPQLLSTTQYVDSIYGASLHMLLTLAGDAFSYSERLLMIGHNPGIDHLLQNVLQQEQAVRVHKMATGTLAIIEFSSNFNRDGNAVKLLQLINRKDLSD